MLSLVSVLSYMTFRDEIGHKSDAVTTYEVTTVENRVRRVRQQSPGQCWLRCRESLTADYWTECSESDFWRTSQASCRWNLVG